MIGEKFGKWTVIEEAEKNKYGKALYKVQCECGTIRMKSDFHLRRTDKCKKCHRLKAPFSNLPPKVE